MFRLIVLAALVACVLGGTLQQGVKAKSDERIVGGQPRAIEDFPFIVSLQTQLLLIIKSHYCGGSIIGEKYVLTAAHCVSASVRPFLIVVAGTNSTSSGGSTYLIRKIVAHELYNDVTMENDLAVITLWTTFTYSNKVQPIGLAAANQVFPSGTIAVVCGWGALSEGGASPTILYCVEVPIINWLNCSSDYQGQDEIYESMVCAGVPEGGKDSCQGDSGGPLTIVNTSTQVGVVSWGIGCARPGLPGVYADVGHNHDWIISKMV